MQIVGVVLITILTMSHQIKAERYEFYVNLVIYPILTFFLSSDCEACQYYFGAENISEYDCAGQCGLCELCDYNHVKECEIFCKKGVHACIENCTLGQAICLSCQQSQSYHYQDQVKYYNNAYEIHTKDPECSCNCNCQCEF